MERELPMLFNTDRVRDILDGRKKATRRIIKFPVNTFTDELPKAQHVKVYGDTLYGETVHFYEEPFYSFYIKPPCRTGDILYVREAWHKDVRRYMYRADYDDNEKFYMNGKEVLIKWHPSIHMPKEAARIWLRVTDVSVERLQNMTLEDFLSEGIVLRAAFNNPKNAYLQARDIFKGIWDSTIPKAKLPEYGWDANPWVWVDEFERCEKPVVHDPWF